MDSLADYRARHALQYNKRVNEERAKEELVAAQLAIEQEKLAKINRENDLFIENIENISIILLVCEYVSIMQFQLEELNTNLDTHINKFNITKESDTMKRISSAILKVFDSVNQNGFTKINFNNLEDVCNSKRICETMNSILSKVGIQHETDTVEVEYEMDCNKDEEIARRLYLEEENRINAVTNIVQQREPQRPVRRPRQPRQPRAHVDVPETQTVQEAEAQTVPPPMPPLEDNNVPIVPRPRGRPRRRNNQII